ncbi:MAG: DUF3180 domain-containing protein [Actinobacteria bacterium]|nr:DUF3180 domain-containing protein [Actinomycetota bacterium]MCA1720424.1 DUF3180 domain-containing protein [Actinomycetota bacterium]
MTPTRIPSLLVTVLLLGLGGYLLAELAYFDLPPLPAFAPVSLLLLTILELGMARVVHGKVHGQTGGRPLHPLQVARAAVLAKASSLGGALLLGLYAGIFVWTFARKDTFATAGDDARVAGLSALTALTLVVAALLLERACRAPRVDE